MSSIPNEELDNYVKGLTDEQLRYKCAERLYPRAQQILWNDQIHPDEPHADLHRWDNDLRKWVLVPDYPHDISAAFILVDSLRDVDTVLIQSGADWICEMYAPSVKNDGNYELVATSDDRDKRPSRVITRTFFTLISARPQLLLQQ